MHTTALSFKDAQRRLEEISRRDAERDWDAALAEHAWPLLSTRDARRWLRNSALLGVMLAVGAIAAQFPLPLVILVVGIPLMAAVGVKKARVHERALLRELKGATRVRYAIQVRELHTETAFLYPNPRPALRELVADVTRTCPTTTPVGRLAQEITDVITVDLGTDEATTQLKALHEFVTDLQARADAQLQIPWREVVQEELASDAPAGMPAVRCDAIDTARVTSASAVL